LYAELYIGMCRALAAPWLGPWLLDSRSGARSCPPAQSTPTAASAAEPPAAEPAAAETTPQPRSSGALIIPFDRARARHAGQH
jgi:hypothetical protein